MKDKEQSKAETWLKENYNEFVVHSTNTGRSIPFFCNMLEDYASQFKSQQSVITEEEIDLAFPIKSDCTALTSDYVRMNTYRREGAKWAIEKQRTDDRELLESFVAWAIKDYNKPTGIDLVIAKELINEFLNGK
jgi:hypothetical protein